MCIDQYCGRISMKWLVFSVHSTEHKQFTKKLAGLLFKLHTTIMLLFLYHFSSGSIHHEADQLHQSSAFHSDGACGQLHEPELLSY